MDELFEDVKEKKHTSSKQIGHLHRKVFLLVFAVALLVQGMLMVDKGLTDYYRRLVGDFKIILTVDASADQEKLQEWGQSLNQKEDIIGVHLFSSQDALSVVRQKNPQLVDALLVMGKNPMPAYFEISLASPAINNIRPFVDNLSAEYEELTPHYNMAQARLLFYMGMGSKFLRVLGLLALLAFLAFMFLVEAAPFTQVGAWRGIVAGLLAAVCSAVLLGAVLYPTGFLEEAFRYFTTWHRQVLLCVFCGLFGWTLAKWQKF